MKLYTTGVYLALISFISLNAMEQADERVGEKRKASEAPNHESLPKQPAQEVLINSQHAIFLDLAAQMREQNTALSTREEQLERAMQLQPPVPKLLPLPNNGGTMPLINQPATPAVMLPPLARATVRHKPVAQPTISSKRINASIKIADKYFYGLGVPKNFAEALKRYIPIAQQNHHLRAQADALLRIGYIYYCGGNGIQKDFSKALYPLTKAAQQTIYLHAQADALRFIGCIYYEGGNGIQKDFSKALEYLTKVARQTNNLHAQADALLCIGHVYYCGGNGIQKDFSKALDTLTKAAQQTIYLHAQADALRLIGCIYYTGRNGIEKDYSKALDPLTKAAQQTQNLKAQAAAQITIGYIYYHGGYGIQKDFSKALDPLTKAAQQTHNPEAQAIAQITNGYIYYYGWNGIKKDPKKALDYLNFAATQTIHTNVQTHAKKALLHLTNNESLPELPEAWSANSITDVERTEDIPEDSVQQVESSANDETETGD